VIVNGALFLRKRLAGTEFTEAEKDQIVDLLSDVVEESRVRGHIDGLREAAQTCAQGFSHTAFDAAERSGAAKCFRALTRLSDLAEDRLRNKPSE